MMKITLCLAAIVACTLNGCARSSAAPRRAAERDAVQTIDSADVRPGVLDPPPVLTDEGPAPKPKTDVTADAPPPPTPKDEAFRASLPFAPAIALDPVSGTKISIRTSTLVLDYKGRLFYFDSEATKRQFLANPSEFTKGVFALPKS